MGDAFALTYNSRDGIESHIKRKLQRTFCYELIVIETKPQTAKSIKCHRRKRHRKRLVGESPSKG